MPKPIRVRFVPFSKSKRSITKEFQTLTPFMAKSFTPDPDQAIHSLEGVSSIGFDTVITPQNAVESLVPSDKFESIFNSTLRSTTKKSLGPKSEEDTVELPVKALELPKSLAETIAFAYVPSPPEFFAANWVPPNTSLYHLRLEDVVLALMGGPCHRRNWRGAGIRVAMTDTGFAKHPYFQRHGYRISRVHTNQTSNPLIDNNGHGTGESANVLALAPDCEFIGVKHDDYSALALETALERKPHIVTNSWGWNIDKYTKEELKKDNPNLFYEVRDLENIINGAIDDGVTMIFSAGNGHYAFPASIPDVLSVGGVTVQKGGDLEASSYASSFRSKLFPSRRVPDVCGVVGEYNSPPKKMRGHIMLPVPPGSELDGENLPKNAKGSGWGIFSGTSASAPQAAGIAALLLSINPNLQPHQIKSILMGTAIDVTKGITALNDDAAQNADNATGAGFINAYEACLMAERLSNDS